jgi:hypothetical protein
LMAWQEMGAACGAAVGRVGYILVSGSSAAAGQCRQAAGRVCAALVYGVPHQGPVSVSSGQRWIQSKVTKV